MTQSPAFDTTADLAELLARYQGRGREALLPLLHEAQALTGWLPPDVQTAIGETLRVPLADIHGVIEFYTMFYNEPTAKRVIRVCEDPACHMAGGPAFRVALEQRIGLRPGETSADGQLTYETVPCLGMCEHAPNALNGARTAGDLRPGDVDAFLDDTFAEPEPRIYGDHRIKLARAGRHRPAEPRRLSGARRLRGLAQGVHLYAGANHRRRQRERRAGPRRGDVPGRPEVGDDPQRTRHARPKSISSANADESEPGTFKDRALMEQDPFSLIEAMTLAAYTVGAENGWIFLRGEYPRSQRRLLNAIEKAREAGYLGRNVMGRDGFHFDIELRLGAGAYICGEETALFEAIEGKRGFPRIKPPYPTTHGLFGQPTVINNVETLAAALAVINMGVEEWRKLGTEGSPGTKWFCLSGRVHKPGVYEVPFGVTVREPDRDGRRADWRHDSGRTARRRGGRIHRPGPPRHTADL